MDYSRVVLSLHKFLDLYRYLCDAHSVDFFIEDHWNTILPVEWRLDLSDGSRAMPSDEALLFPREHGVTGINPV